MAGAGGDAHEHRARGRASGGALRRSRGRRRRLARGGGGQHRGPPGIERRRQDHHAQRDRGSGAGERRPDRLAWREHHQPAGLCDRAKGPGALARGLAPLREPDGGAEPAPRRHRACRSRANRDAAGTGLRGLSTPRRAAAPARRHALRRRAADAGAGPRPHERPKAPDAGRAEPRPRADDRGAALRHAGAPARRWAHSAARGAVRAPRSRDRRLRLRPPDRPHGPRRPGRRLGERPAGAAHLSWDQRRSGRLSIRCRIGRASRALRVGVDCGQPRYPRLVLGVLDGRMEVIARATMFPMRRPVFAALVAVALLSPRGGADAADFTVEQVSEMLASATPERPADLSRADLGFLDLSDLDFKRAKLAGANLYGVDLSRSDLSGADLSGADLDHAVITATNFSNANLYDIAAYSRLEPSSAEAPSFAGADLSGAELLARLTDVDLHGANLSGLRIGFSAGLPRTPLRNDLSGCNLAGAKLAGADLHEVRLSFSKLEDADLSGANLVGADLTQVDLTGANLAGANLANADLDGAVLRRVRGLEQARGLDLARNRERAVY